MRGGRSDALRVSLDDVDPSGGYWAIQATCPGADLQVEFRPRERVSAPGFGDASSEEISVECGEPERVAVTDEELRRRTATPTGADLATPTSNPSHLSCADGSLLVEAHPVWAQDAIVGGALRIERGGHTIVDGAIVSEEYEPGAPQLRWWSGACSAE